MGKQYREIRNIHYAITVEVARPVGCAVVVEQYRQVDDGNVAVAVTIPRSRT